MSIELVTVTGEFKTAGGAVLMNTPISFILREDIASEDDVYHAQVFRGWINASGLLKAADGSSAFQLPTYSNGTSAARFSVVMPRGVNLKDYMTVPSGKLNFNLTYSASPLQLAGLLNTGAGAATDTVLVAIDDAIDNAGVRFDKAQSLTSPQKVQALSNIGLPSLSDTGAVTTFAATSESVFNNSVRIGGGSYLEKRALQIIKNNWSPTGHPNLIWLEGSIANSVKGHAIELYWTKLATNTYNNSFGGIIGEVTNESTVGTGTYGISIGVEYKGVNPSASTYGGDFRSTISNGGHVDKAIGVNSIVTHYQDSTLAVASLFKGQFAIGGAASVTPNIRGLDLSGWSATGGGLIDNVYGIYIDNSIDFGETTYAIKCDSISPSVFAGSMTASSFSTAGTINATGAVTAGSMAITQTNYAPGGTSNLINVTATVDNNQSVRGLNITLTRNNAGTGGAAVFPIITSVTNAYVGTTNFWNAHSFTVLHTGTGVNATTMRGQITTLSVTAGATATTAVSVFADLLSSGTSSTITTGILFNGRATCTSSGTITNLIGLNFSGWTKSSATVTTSYGIYADTSIDIGTTKYFIYSLSTSPSLFSGDIEIANKNLIFAASTGTKIGTATSQKIGFWNATPVVQQVLSAYSTDAESAYTGIDNAQVGSVYAQLTDLNSLRFAYENLRVAYDDLRTKLQTIGVLG